jgi:chromate reductase, NAD(P)H dehydrogenase (quinone)
VTPEHSRSIPAVLKSAIDWGARPWGKNSWTGKPAAVTGTSPGAIGTAIAQQHLRAVLGDLGMLVMGGETYVTFKPELVDADGNIADETSRTFLKAFLDQLAGLTGKMTAKSAPRAAA